MGFEMSLRSWWSGKLRSLVMQATDENDGARVPLYKEIFDVAHKTEFESLWKQLSDLERHEDSLFNSRTQSFLVVTSFLLAGLSQFRERPYFVVQLLFCCFGMGISTYTYLVLRRTAGTIEWYLEALIRLDKALYREDLQPYRTRRVRTGKRSAGENEATKGTPVSAVFGVVLPLAAAALWASLFCWSFVHYVRAPSDGKETSITPAPQSQPALQVIVIQETVDRDHPRSAPPDDRKTEQGGAVRQRQPKTP
jgi:hypothetical protein